jgi:hypothetical protein
VLDPECSSAHLLFVALMRALKSGIAFGVSISITLRLDENTGMAYLAAMAPAIFAAFADPPVLALSATVLVFVTLYATFIAGERRGEGRHNEASIRGGEPDSHGEEPDIEPRSSEKEDHLKCEPFYRTEPRG